MTTTMKINLFIILAAIAFYSSCGNKMQTQADLTDVSAQLLAYLEKHGNFINSDAVPALISAEVVFNNMDKNHLIIDIREEDAFSLGHIEGAKNITPDSILYFFENIIEPNSFDTIVLTCDIGARSSYVCALLRLLGYDNVFSLRFGLASWHHSIAENTWLSALSSKLEGRLDTIPSALSSRTELPYLPSAQSDMYKVLRERVSKLLAENIREIIVGIDAVLENPDQYYLINYWPYELYKKGHLPGAVQFTPKQAFHSESQIQNVPPDKPVLIYCYSGQNGSFVAAFLRVLGYDAYSMKYGANSFIYETMKNTQRPSRVFSENHIKNYPLSTTQENANKPEINMPISIPVKGGC